MTDLVSLGEMMLRLSPPKFERLRQTSGLDVRPCGAQFNVAADLAALGKESVFLTLLPDNELGHLAYKLGAGHRLDMSRVKFRPGGRMGLIFVEFSRSPRRQIHIYDRERSAASGITSEDFDWKDALQGARFAYTDGIFPALNQGCREATMAFLNAARAANCTVCFDVNYRPSLWSPDEARAVYQQILPLVDILVTNRSVSEQVLGLGGSDQALLEAYGRLFGTRLICLTGRETGDISRGSWWSMAYQAGVIFEGRGFNFDVVDQFGTGDAFFAGLLYALSEDRQLPYALDFGNALCALAHTVEGDPAIFSPEEVEAVLEEGYSLVTRR